MLRMHKTLVIHRLTYVQNIMQPSFVCPVDVVSSYAINAIIRPSGPKRHLDRFNRSLHTSPVRDNADRARYV